VSLTPEDPHSDQSGRRAAPNPCMQTRPARQESSMNAHQHTRSVRRSTARIAAALATATLGLATVFAAAAPASAIADAEGDAIYLAR
jgi:hypothetical protein